MVRSATSSSTTVPRSSTKQVQADYIGLLGLAPDWQAALDRYDIDTIVWQRDLPLATMLKESPDWQIRYTDPHWIVANSTHGSRHAV